jgi:hypothetical protein
VAAVEVLDSSLVKQVVQAVVVVHLLVQEKQAVLEPRVKVMMAVLELLSIMNQQAVVVEQVLREQTEAEQPPI